MNKGILDLSVIIPAYNIAEYVAEALDSVIHQEPQFKRIIVIDDGSTDNTRDVIAHYDDPRILYYYQENQGLGPARNKGLELCDTEYVYFMDGDDVLVDGMTSFIHKEIASSASRPDAIFFSAVDFDHSTRKVLASSEYFQWRSPGTFATGESAMLAALSSNSLPACAFIYVFSRKLIDRNADLRFMNIIHEDEAFTPDLMLQCGRTVVSDQILYRRRVRKNSIMTSQANMRNVIGCLVVSRKWAERARLATEGKSALYQLQAHRYYNSAIRYAARAKIGLKEIESAVHETMPRFSAYVRFDYTLSRFSRRIAFDFGNLRARFFANV